MDGFARLHASRTNNRPAKSSLPSPCPSPPLTPKIGKSVLMPGSTNRLLMQAANSGQKHEYARGCIWGGHPLSPSAPPPFPATRNRHRGRVMGEGFGSAGFSWGLLRGSVFLILGFPGFQFMSIAVRSEELRGCHRCSGGLGPGEGGGGGQIGLEFGHQCVTFTHQDCSTYGLRQLRSTSRHGMRAGAGVWTPPPSIV